MGILFTFKLSVASCSSTSLTTGYSSPQVSCSERLPYGMSHELSAGRDESYAEIRPQEAKMRNPSHLVASKMRNCHNLNRQTSFGVQGDATWLWALVAWSLDDGVLWGTVAWACSPYSSPPTPHSNRADAPSAYHKYGAFWWIMAADQRSGPNGQLTLW